MFTGAIARAMQYLQGAVGPEGLFPDFISAQRECEAIGQPVYEFFSTALIAGALPQGQLKRFILDKYFVRARKGLFTFYPDSTYPPDTDTNAVVFSVLLLNGYPVEQEAGRVMDEIIHYASDGVAQVWLDPKRQNHYDPVVAVNAEVLAVLTGRRHELPRNRDFIINHLVSENFLNGTRYYHSPDAFLYFLARLSLVDESFYALVYKVLKTAVMRRRQTTCHPLDMAQRMIVLKVTETDFAWEQEKLLSLQEEDGSLPPDALFHFGAKKGFFCSKAVSTAFFIKALNLKI